MIIGFGGTLLTLFGDGSARMEYLAFAVALLLLLVMLIGSYWFVMVEPAKVAKKRPPSQKVDSRKFAFLSFSDVRLPHARHTGAPVSGVAVLSESKPRGPTLFDTTSDTTRRATRRNVRLPRATKTAYLSRYCNALQRLETNVSGL